MKSQYLHMSLLHLASLEEWLLLHERVAFHSIQTWPKVLRHFTFLVVVGWGRKWLKNNTRRENFLARDTNNHVLPKIKLREDQFIIQHTFVGVRISSLRGEGVGREIKAVLLFNPLMYCVYMSVSFKVKAVLESLITDLDLMLMLNRHIALCMCTIVMVFWTLTAKLLYQKHKSLCRQLRSLLSTWPRLWL